MSLASCGSTSPCSLEPARQTTASSIFPAFKAARRLDVLSAVLDASEKVHEPDRAVIGRRVTLLEEGGDSVTYALVFPGDGDPLQGWISADSPLGAAVLGCTAGDRVEVIAPVRTAVRHRGLGRLASRMLSYMTSPGVGGSPLAVAALALVRPGATAADLETPVLRGRRRPSTRRRRGPARPSSNRWVSSGSPGEPPAREYVLSSLGRRLVEHGAWTDAAVPMKDLERMRTDFLSIIAHELRTPITVMRTLTGLLLDPASDPTAEQRRTMLETMERNAERMQHLIGEILDLARYRAGTIGLQLRQFDATELAESAVATIRPLAEGRNQAVELRRAARSRAARVRRPPAPRSRASEPGRQCPSLRAGRRADHGPPAGSDRRHDPLVRDRRRTGHLRSGPGAPVRAVLRRAR